MLLVFLYHQNDPLLHNMNEYSECDKTFGQIKKSVYVQEKKLQEKKLKCSECGMAFVLSVYLKAHLIIDTQEKKFTCSE